MLINLASPLGSRPGLVCALISGVYGLVCVFWPAVEVCPEIERTSIHGDFIVVWSSVLVVIGSRGIFNSVSVNHFDCRLRLSVR